MTQGELEKIPLPLQQQFSALEMRIMSDVVERIRVNGFSTATADWEISRLQQLGEVEENIKKWIKDTLSTSDEEIQHIFSDEVYEQYYGYSRAYKLSGMSQIAFEDNTELKQLIHSIKQQTYDECKNITNSLGFAIRNPETGKIITSPLLNFYQSTLDAAMLDIHSGAFDYNTVLSRTINRMTTSGVRYVDYDSGVHNRVEVAARRAVMTGFRQVQGKINEQVAKDLETDSYEVSWHGGARPTHQVWQGKVYTHRELEDICELGSVTGLLGANCYHDYNAFIPGVSVRTYTDEWLEEQNTRENTPKEYDGKEYTTYQALQQQRMLERVMRKSRQDIDLLKKGDANPEQIMLKKAKYQGQMQTYKGFSEKMKLPEQMERVYQDGLGKISGKSVANQSESGIIKTEGLKRKKNSISPQPMNKKQLQKIVKGFRRSGGFIQMDTSTDEYLDSKKAEAITYNATTILLKQKPGRASVFEELIHATQYRQGKNDGSIEARLMCEIEAQEKLIRYSEAYKLTKEEVRQTAKTLKSYQLELEQYLKSR